MTQTRWARWCPALLALLTAAPLAAADKIAATTEASPLAQVPAKAPIVVSVRGFQRTQDRLVTMIKNAMPDLGPTVQAKMDDLLKDGMFQGRQLKGLKDDGHILLAVLAMPGKDLDSDKPQAAVIVRVTDYKAFRDGLLKEDERKSLKKDKAGYEVAKVEDGELYFIDRKDYAVVTPRPDTAADLVKRKGKGLDTVVTGALAHKLLEADVAAFVNMAEVNEAFGPQIKAGMKFITDALEVAENNPTGRFTPERVKAVRVAAAGAMQALQDSKGALLTVDFRPRGLAVHFGMSFQAQSKTNDFLKMLKPSPLAKLGALPAGFTNYTAANFGPQAYEAVHPLFKAIMAAAPEEGDKAQAKALQGALDEMLAAGPGRWQSATRLGEGGQDELKIGQYGDPAKAVAAQLKLFKALEKGGDFAFTVLKDRPAVKAAAEKYRDGTLHHARLKWDLDKMAEDTPGGEEVLKVLKRLHGEEHNVWFGVVDKLYVEVSAPTWAVAKKYLDRYFEHKDPIGGTKHKIFARDRAEVAKEANLVSLTNVSQFAQYIAEAMYPMFKALLNVDVKVPPAPKNVPVSYLAMSLTMREGEAGFELWIPGGAARDFRRVFEPLVKAMMGMNE